MAIEMKRKFPDLQMFVDNSHICGRRDTLQEVAQEALNPQLRRPDDRGVHPRPDEAWSDARQQITPKVFGEMLQNLRLRKPTASELEMADLIELRRQIDEVDNDPDRDDRPAHETGRLDWRVQKQPATSPYYKATVGRPF